MNQNRVNEIYQTLEEITLSIPDFNSPDEINSAIFQCRKRINQVESLAVEVNRAISKIRRELSSSKKERQISYNKLMSSDDRVKRGKSGLDRQAIADALLCEKDKEIADLESTVLDLKYLSEAIDLRISNLNKTNSDIRLSWNIMQNTHQFGSNHPDQINSIETELSPEDLASLDINSKALPSTVSDFDEEDFSSLLSTSNNLESKEKTINAFSTETPKESDSLDVSLDLDSEDVGTPIDLDSLKTKEVVETKIEDPNVAVALESSKKLEEETVDSQITPQEDSAEESFDIDAAESFDPSDIDDFLDALD